MCREARFARIRSFAMSHSDHARGPVPQDPPRSQLNVLLLALAVALIALLGWQLFARRKDEPASQPPPYATGEFTPISSAQQAEALAAALSPFAGQWVGQLNAVF